MRCLRALHVWGPAPTARWEEGDAFLSLSIQTQAMGKPTCSIQPGVRKGSLFGSLQLKKTSKIPPTHPTMPTDRIPQCHIYTALFNLQGNPDGQGVLTPQLNRFLPRHQKQKVKAMRKKGKSRA